MHIEISAFGYELYLGPRQPGPLERLTPVLLSLIPLVLGGARPSAAKAEREDGEERDEDLAFGEATLQEIVKQRIDALEDKAADLNAYMRERVAELRDRVGELEDLVNAPKDPPITRADLEPVLLRFTALEDKVKGLAAYIPSPAPRA